MWILQDFQLEKFLSISLSVLYTEWTILCSVVSTTVLISMSVDWKSRPEEGVGTDDKTGTALVVPQEKLDPSLLHPSVRGDGISSGQRESDFPNGPLSKVGRLLGRHQQTTLKN